MKVVKEIARQIEAACLRHRIRTDRRRRGLPTDLKAVVAEYRQYNLYAALLERTQILVGVVEHVLHVLVVEDVHTSCL